MTSGVKPSDEVKAIINKMKLVKTEDSTQERIRLVVLKIDEIKGEIQVERIFTQKEFEIDVDRNNVPDAFEAFTKEMNPDICRYILYDCHYETKETNKEELVFAAWCPDSSPIKQKMCYASTKNAIKPLIMGVKHELQLNDLSECTRDLFAEKLSRDCVGIEGKNLKGQCCKKS